MYTTKNMIRSALACGVLLTSALAAHADTIGYWRFEDSPGFTADSSTNGFTLLTSGGSAWPPPQQSPVQVPAGGFDNPVPQNGLGNAGAASFNGSSQYFRVTDKPEFAVSDFTIEAYVRRDVNDVRHVIASQYKANQNNRSWALFVEGSDVSSVDQNDPENNQLTLFASGNGQSSADWTHYSGIKIDAGVDYFVAASFDESDQTSGVKFYVKNLATGAWAESAVDHSVTSLQNSNGDFNISGYDNGPRLWDGLIDEVRWSNTVLSKSELLAVPEPGTLAMFAMGLLGLLAFGRRRRFGR